MSEKLRNLSEALIVLGSCDVCWKSKSVVEVDPAGMEVMTICQDCMAEIFDEAKR
jgi:hypothetical protein